jgi:hypothetical protein
MKICGKNVCKNWRGTQKKTAIWMSWPKLKFDVRVGSDIFQGFMTIRKIIFFISVHSFFSTADEV